MAKEKKTIDIFNPFDGKKISEVSSADSNQIKIQLNLLTLLFKVGQKRALNLDLKF